MATPAPTTDARPAKRRCFLPQETPAAFAGEEATRKTLQHEPLACLSQNGSGQDMTPVSAAPQVGPLSSAALLQLVQSQSTGGVPQAVIRNLFTSLHRNPLKTWQGNPLPPTASSVSLYASTPSSSSTLPGVGTAYPQASSVSADFMQGEAFACAGKATAPDASPLFALLGEAARTAAVPRPAAPLSAPGCPSAAPASSLPPAETLALAQSAFRSLTGGACDPKTSSSRPEEHPAFAASAAASALNRQSLLRALLLSTAPLASSVPSIASVSPSLAVPAGVVSRNTSTNQLERLLLQAEVAKGKNFLPNATPLSKASQPSTPRRDILTKPNILPDTRGLSADEANRRYNTRGANSAGVGMRRGTGAPSTPEPGSALDATERTGNLGAGERSMQGTTSSRGRQEQSALDPSNLLGLLAALQPSQASVFRDLSASSSHLLSAAPAGALPSAIPSTPSSTLASSPCLPSASASSTAAASLSEVLPAVADESAARRATDASTSALLAFLQKTNALASLGTSDFLDQLQGRGSPLPLTIPDAAGLPASLLSGGPDGTVETRSGNGGKNVGPLQLLQSASRLPSSSQQALLDALLASSYSASAARTDGSGALGIPGSERDERGSKLAAPAHPLACSFPQTSSSDGSPGRKASRVHRQGASSQNGGRVRRGKSGNSVAPQRQASSESVMSYAAGAPRDAPQRGFSPQDALGDLAASPPHPLDILRLGAFSGGAGKQDISVHSDETATLSGEPSQRSSLSRVLTQESVLQLSDSTSASREGEPHTLGASKAAAAFLPDSAPALGGTGKDAAANQGCGVLSASLPSASGTQTSTVAPKTREGRRGAGASGAPPPVPLRAVVTLGGNRPHYHVAKQEWRVRYYMNGKRKMRTYSAKFYGYETAHTMAEDFAHYVDKHEALPDSMMMTAMMLQAQANAAASPGQTAPVARGVRASGALAGEGQAPKAASTKNGVTGSSETATPPSPDFSVSQEGEAGEPQPLASGSSRSLSSVRSASSVPALGRQEKKADPARHTWFGEPSQAPGSEATVHAPGACSNDGREGLDAADEALWAALGKVPDTTTGKQDQGEILPPTRRRPATPAENKPGGVGNERSECEEALEVADLQACQSGEESSLREGEAGIAVFARDPFQFLSSRTPPPDHLALPFSGGVEALYLSSAFPSSGSSLPLASEAADFSKERNGHIAAVLPSHPRQDQAGSSLAAQPEDFPSQCAKLSTPPLPPAVMQDIKGEEGEMSRRFAIVCESMSKNGAPEEVKSLLPATSLPPTGVLAADFLQLGRCGSDGKSGSALPQGFGGNGHSVTATAVAATAVSHQIFDTITLFGEFLREFAKEKVNEFHEYGLNAPPLTVEAVPEVSSLFLNTDEGRNPFSLGNTATTGKTSCADAGALPELASQLSLESARTNGTTGEAQFALARGLFPGNDLLDGEDEKKPELGQPELLVLSHTLVNLTSSTYVLMHTLKASLTKSTEAVQLHQPLLAGAPSETDPTEKEEKTDAKTEFSRGFADPLTDATPDLAFPDKLSPALTASTNDPPPLSASASLETVAPFSVLPLEDAALRASASGPLASTDEGETQASSLFKESEASKKRDLFSAVVDLEAAGPAVTFSDSLGQHMDEESRSCVSTSCGETVATTLSAIGAGMAGSAGTLLDSEPKYALEMPNTGGSRVAASLQWSAASLAAGSNTPAPTRTSTSSGVFSFTCASTATPALGDFKQASAKEALQSKDAGDARGEPAKPEAVEMGKEAGSDCRRRSGSPDVEGKERTEEARGEHRQRSEKRPSVIATALGLLETHQHLALTISQLKGPVSQQLRFILRIAAPQLLPCVLPPASFQRSSGEEVGADAKGEHQSNRPPSASDVALEHGEKKQGSAEREIEGASAECSVKRESASAAETEKVSRKRPREEADGSERGEEEDLAGVALDQASGPGADKSSAASFRRASTSTRVIRDEASLERLLLAPFQDTPVCSCTDRPCPCDRQQVADMIYLLYAIPARQQACKTEKTRSPEPEARPEDERTDAQTGPEGQREASTAQNAQGPNARGHGEGEARPDISIGVMSSCSDHAPHPEMAEIAASADSEDGMGQEGQSRTSGDAHMVGECLLPSSKGPKTAEGVPLALRSQPSFDVNVAVGRGFVADSSEASVQKPTESGDADPATLSESRSDEQQRTSFSSSSLLAAGHAMASFSSSLIGVAPVVGAVGERKEGEGPSLDLSTIGLLSLSYSAMLAFILPLQSLLHTVSSMILTLHKKLIHRFICAHLRRVLEDDIRCPEDSTEKKRKKEAEDEGESRKRGRGRERGDSQGENALLSVESGEVAAREENGGARPEALEASLPSPVYAERDGETKERGDKFTLLNTVVSLLSTDSLPHKTTETDAGAQEEEALPRTTADLLQPTEASEEDSASPFLSCASGPAAAEADLSYSSAPAAFRVAPTGTAAGVERGDSDLASLLSLSADVHPAVLQA
ncbi:unnamed protein product [Neospora caninum Liverpool]|uniref:AP2 domain transcription factor AP2IV-4 n=1 Tax=Neospora caninum (strain Liverpool) TaxID=572307 RepID=F0VAF1_NEOCL|nr:uncharacterized protein NCLIV_011080 [Neospora caninum Liverpool]CBZ50640.1 unnamed protein product [Neospora caninum Liverpool]CEL65252.1 TPA: AP2 domain transcription factor AP2IV-4 [Neospora caninum Liverpool]|eukprot:XP_003880673.1 uncharacterized protein NCLIV_011080 [Neospora caninum Liverpool]